MRRIVAVAACGMVVLNADRANSQSPAAAEPRFEVASVKSSPSPFAATAGGGAISFASFGVHVQPGGRLAAVATLQMLVLRAYGIQDYQLEGGPKWLTTDYFDISAKAERETATEAELNAMIRSLLAERFGLRVHVETRQAPVFTLTARADGRLGTGLKRTSPECEKQLEERKRTGASAPPLPRPSGPSPTLTPICGTTSGMMNARTATETVAMGGRPFADLVTRLSNVLRAPVIDRSGLSGLFDVVLEYESTRLVGGLPRGPDLNSTDPLPVPLPAAVQQQLGLKLEKGVGPLPITIVDAAAPPSPD